MLGEKTVFWTGATGFFGRALLRNLSDLGDKRFHWYLLSRDPLRFARDWPELVQVPKISWQRGDMRELKKLQCTSPTYVVHAAADVASAFRLTSLERFDQILEGTRRVLDFAVAKGACRFLFVSSGGVYGHPATLNQTLREDYFGIPDPLNAANAYGSAKRAAEHLCALYAQRYKLEIVVARCFSFVGEDLPIDAHFAIGNLIRDALYASEIIVNGDGSPVRSYLDQRDLVRWLLKILTDGKAGEAYNVGSDRPISIADLARLVRDLVSPGKRVRFLGEADENLERNCYLPDTSKAAVDLGLRPAFSLEESILHAAERLKRRKQAASFENPAVWSGKH
jgi:UDP-glucuronate decarboxylase